MLVAGEIRAALVVSAVTGVLNLACTAEQLQRVNRELQMYDEKLAADERARLDAENSAQREREQQCASRPNGTYVVGLLAVSAAPRKPDGTTWDADLRGAETYIGKAARSGVKYLAAQSNLTLALSPSVIDWIARRADSLFTEYAGKLFSSLVAPDMELTAVLDGDAGRAVRSDYLRDSYSVVFDSRQPFGFALALDCSSRPGQHRIDIHVIDRDLMVDDPMFTISIDPYSVAMAAGDGRRGAIVSMKGDAGLGVVSYVVGAIPLGSADPPLVGDYEIEPERVHSPAGKTAERMRPGSLPHPELEKGLAPSDGGHCGPESILKYIPRWVARSVQDAIAKDLRPACQAHDRCYSAKVKSQNSCDLEFARDMERLCSETYQGRFVAYQLCLWKATLFYDAVASAFGGRAYGGGSIGGEIVKHRSFVKKDHWGDDEFIVCVSIRNPTPRVLEYKVLMFSHDWKLIDTEPDTFEANIQPGMEREICVGTDGKPGWSVSNIGSTYHIVARVDDPDRMALFGDMITVDHREYRR